MNSKPRYAWFFFAMRRFNNRFFSLLVRELEATSRSKAWTHMPISRCRMQLGEQRVGNVLGSLQGDDESIVGVYHIRIQMNLFDSCIYDNWNGDSSIQGLIMWCPKEPFLPTIGLLPFLKLGVKVQNLGNYGRKRVCVGTIVPLHHKLQDSCGWNGPMFRY